MKRFVTCLALLALFSCTKEKRPSLPSGSWTIVESNIGTGTGFVVQTYQPSSELTVEFGADGKLLLTGNNPGTANSPLWEFDRYEMKPNNHMRFYQSGGSKEMEAFATVNGELHLNYLQTTCGYEEKFLRVK